MPRKQGAWGLWWLCVITFGIYYLVWFDRVAAEMAEATSSPRDGMTKWWSQIIPIYGLIALSRTAKQLNQAHASLGSTVRVSPVVTWLWSAIWFASTPRYLQRRVNILADIQMTHRVAA